MACLGGSRPPPFYYEIWSIFFCARARAVCALTPKERRARRELLWCSKPRGGRSFPAAPLGKRHH
eukprot:6018712-Pyramimonas_sp.AAC.1